MDEAVERLSKVFGVAGLSRAAATEKKMDVILSTAVEYLRDELESASTFKVNAKRADKKFPLTSPEICRDAGEYILERFPHLRVDVKSPELTVTIEIRDFDAFIRGMQIKGAGGMPSGTGGRGMLLISGA